MQEAVEPIASLANVFLQRTRRSTEGWVETDLALETSSLAAEGVDAALVERRRVATNREMSGGIWSELRVQNVANGLINLLALALSPPPIAPNRERGAQWDSMPLSLNATHTSMDPMTSSLHTGAHACVASPPSAPTTRVSVPPEDGFRRAVLANLKVGREGLAEKPNGGERGRNHGLRGQGETADQIPTYLMEALRRAHQVLLVSSWGGSSSGDI